MIEARQNIIDACREVHDRAGNICQHPRCQERSVQVAHSIPKGKTGRRRVKRRWAFLFQEHLTIHGKKMDSIIHHRFNVWSSCIKHNSYFLTLANSEPLFEDLLINIWDDLKNG